MELIQTKNLLTKEEEDHFKSKEFWNYFPFYYLVDPTPTAEGYSNFGSLSHTLVNRWYEYGESSPTVNSDSYKFFKELFDRFCDINDIQYTRVLRMALNLTMNISAEFIAAPHVDHILPHNLCILYLNDSGGPTVFFKQKWEEGAIFDIEKSEIIEESHPEMGKMIQADGGHYHTARPCEQDTYRLVMVLTYN